MTIRILGGDVREQLAKLPSDSFDCIVTSPPYWGLRDYGVAGQIGLELNANRISRHDGCCLPRSAAGAEAQRDVLA
jgi:DNA modification methylase